MTPTRERLLLVVALSAVYSLYWPVNQLSATLPSHTLQLPIDVATPLAPEWLYVYGLLFVTCYLPVLVVRDRALFRRIAIAALVLEMVSLATFLLYPVRYGLRATNLPPADTLTNWGMHFMYWLDEPTNCFPSLHVGAAALAAAGCWKADRPVASLALVNLVLVGASTMLVKQHYLADVLGASVLVGVLYLTIIAPLDLSDRTEAELRFSRRWLAVIPALYVVFIVTFYALYAAGWAPWLDAR